MILLLAKNARFLNYNLFFKKINSEAKKIFIVFVQNVQNGQRFLNYLLLVNLDFLRMIYLVPLNLIFNHINSYPTKMINKSLL